MNKRLAVWGAAACLWAGAGALQASDQVGMEDAGSARRILDLIGGRKAGTIEAPPVRVAEQGDRVRAQEHGHDEDMLYVSCQSLNYARRECYVGTDRPIDYVTVYRQHSRAACTRGDTWGFDQHHIWVSNGCQAEFAIRTFQGRLVEKNILCESSDYNRRTCWTGLRAIRDVYVRQNSRAACTRGTTWGLDGSNVWVSNGCRGSFTVIGYEPR